MTDPNRRKKRKKDFNVEITYNPPKTKASPDE